MTNRENYKRAFSALQPSEGFSCIPQDVSENTGEAAFGKAYMKTSKEAASTPRKTNNISSENTTNTIFDETYKETSEAVSNSASSTPRRCTARRRRFYLQPAIAAAALVIIIAAGATTAYAADIGGIQRKIQVWLHGDLTEAVLTVDEKSGTYTVTDESGHQEMAGGGVKVNADGSTQPVSAEEMYSHLADQVETDTVDSRLYLLYKDQKFDITDAFKDSDAYYVTLKDGNKTLYVTVMKDGSLAYGPYRYLLPGKDFDASTSNGN